MNPRIEKLEALLARVTVRAREPRMQAAPLAARAEATVDVAPLVAASQVVAVASADGPEVAAVAPADGHEVIAAVAPVPPAPDSIPIDVEAFGVESTTRVDIGAVSGATQMDLGPVARAVVASHSADAPVTALGPAHAGAIGCDGGGLARH